MKKERITMVVSSAFVLAALTMTGIYMNRDNKAAIDKGYTVDFGALEKSADEKFDQIAQRRQEAENSKEAAPDGTGAGGMAEGAGRTAQDAPMRVALNDTMDDALAESFAGSADQTVQDAPVSPAMPEEMAEDALQTGNAPLEQEAAVQAVSGSKPAAERELHFTKEGAHVPIYGDVLMAYNMEETVYFKTLQQYRRNPAVLYSAQPDVEVFACAEAKVLEVSRDAKLGNQLVLDLGDGYQATYGQLKNIQVSKGSYVEAGEVIAEVDNPTKYYSEEGCNLYFELRQNGAAVNPGDFF